MDGAGRDEAAQWSDGEIRASRRCRCSCCCLLSLFSWFDATLYPTQCYSWMSLGKPPISPWKGEHPPTPARTAVATRGTYPWLSGGHSHREVLPLLIVYHVPVSYFIFLCWLSFFLWLVCERFFLVCRFLVFIAFRCRVFAVDGARTTGGEGGGTVLFFSAVLLSGKCPNSS